MDEVRVLLIAAPGKPHEAYVRRLQELGVQFDAIGGVNELRSALRETPYNGLLVDVATMIRATGPEKSQVHELLERFPVLRLAFDAEKAEIRGLAYGQSLRNPRTLDAFISLECVEFVARTIRVARRRGVHFNVLLWPGGDPGGRDAAEKTVTCNASEYGSFILSTRDWEGRETASAVFLELSDRTPLLLDVRWTIPWGAGMRMPGIGTRFASVTPSQREEILSRLA